MGARADRRGGSRLGHPCVRGELARVGESIDELPDMVVTTEVGFGGRELTGGFGQAVHVAIQSGRTAGGPDGYQPFRGTSGAAPRVSNVAAKCLVLDPTLDPPALKALLIGATTRIEQWAGLTQSSGMLDPALAYAAAAKRTAEREGTAQF
jgi:subtilisin family serine protease